MTEPLDNAAVIASSAGEADSCEQAVGSLQDSSDGSCSAANASKYAEVLAAVRKQVIVKPVCGHLMQQPIQVSAQLTTWLCCQIGPPRVYLRLLQQCIWTAT